MKIAILGSAPSSMRLAPYGDQSWKIWGCSPGLYPGMPRCDAWFELHRWEPPVIGKPDSQKPWFSPEYVQWMAGLRCPVWMFLPVPEIPTSLALPAKELMDKWGNYFMTSSIAWMMAMAIDQILLEREADRPEGTKDAIGLWGVDMAATEEYGYQRAGCQYFIQMANNLGIDIVVPPESDLLRPMPPYGICETDEYWIKATERKRELTARLANHQQQVALNQRQVDFLSGALDDLNYHMQTWHQHGAGIATHVGVWARSPFLTNPVPAPAEAPRQSIDLGSTDAIVNPWEASKNT